MTQSRSRSRPAQVPRNAGGEAGGRGRSDARLVQDVMSPDLACCFPDASLIDVARLMVAHDCGEIPVLDPETKAPIGVVTDRDIVCRTIAERKNPLDLHASDCMSAPVITVTPDMPLDRCCALFEEHMIRRAPVVDDRGRCCGVVSQADVATKASPELSAEMLHQVSQPARPTTTAATR